jgi:hypothetical protein
MPWWERYPVSTFHNRLRFIEDPVGMAVLIDVGHAALGLDENTIIVHTIFIQQGLYNVVIHVVQIGDPANQSVGVFSFHEITFFHIKHKHFSAVCILRVCAVRHGKIDMEIDFGPEEEHGYVGANPTPALWLAVSSVCFRATAKNANVRYMNTACADGSGALTP